MSRIDPLSIAMSGLANVNRGLAVISQNIANANTPGYVHETHQQSALGAGGLPLGVVSGLTVRDLNVALQDQLTAQNAAVGQDSTRADALARIDLVLGKPGAGNDLTSLIGHLRDGFSALLTDPSSAPQQQAVVDDARAVTSQLHATAQSIATERQTAQDQMVTDVGTLNAALARIGGLSRQIIQVRAVGGSTADLENQRDAAAQGASGLLSLKFIGQANGDMMVLTTSGLELPTSGAGLVAKAATLGPAAAYPGGGVPGVTLNGQDVTTALNSGSIGADLTLRDSTLPTYQGTLDEFAQNMAGRFAAQGLVLFTDPAGVVPVAAAVGARQAPYVGFSATITVNPAVLAQPSQVRDGNAVIVAAPGGAQAFVPNGAGGPAGFNAMITRVLDFSLTGQLSPTAVQPAPNLAGMGPFGGLASPIAAPAALGDFATAIISAQGADAASAANSATAGGDAGKALSQSLSQQSGVNMDSELSAMVQLQNAYSANARVITTMQALWTQLLQSVQ